MDKALLIGGGRMRAERRVLAGAAALAVLTGVCRGQTQADPPVPDVAGGGDASDERLDLAPASFWSGWVGNVEFGLNGSEGNSETLNFRAGASATRTTDRMATKVALVYARASQDSEVTQNRAQLDARNDWILARGGKGSRWRYFVTGSLEYDDFQDWNERLTLGNGVGYAFVETDRTLLLGRVGVGVVREFGGSDNRWRPEGIIGLDLSHQLTERQKVTAAVEFLPELLELGPYRANARAAYEILVDPETKMSLKLGVEDRYDSSPGEGRKRNDLDYFALLVWSF